MSAEPIATHKQKDVGSIRTLVAHPAECQRDDLYQKNPALYQLDRGKGIGIQTMRSGTSCWRSACHKDPQCTKAFDKSKFTIHTGLPVATVLSMTKLAVSKCSSMRYFARKPCCSSGCVLSSCFFNPSTDHIRNYMCCRATLGWNLSVSFAYRQYGNWRPMLQLCPGNVGPARFWNIRGARKRGRPAYT